MSELRIVRGALAELRAQHFAAAAGDARARAWFGGLWAEGTECFLCGQTVAEAVAVILPDPAAAPLGGMIVPECRDCHFKMNRPARELKMIRAMWPKTVWRVGPPGRRPRRG